MKLQFNGPCKNYVDAMQGAGIVDVPSANSVCKMVSEFMNEEMVSSCWITNTHMSIDASENLIRRKVMCNVLTLNCLHNFANIFNLIDWEAFQHVNVHRRPTQSRSQRSI